MSWQQDLADKAYEEYGPHSRNAHPSIEPPQFANANPPSFPSDDMPWIVGADDGYVSANALIDSGARPQSVYPNMAAAHLPKMRRPKFFMPWYEMAAYLFIVCFCAASAFILFSVTHVRP